MKILLKPSIKFSIITFLILIFLAACQRPAPRPENVQVTTFPNIPTVAPSPTSDAAATAEATTASTSGEQAEATAETQATAVSEETVSWPQTHIVAAGDTLSQIAVLFETTVEEIMAANNLTDADTLEIGQTLTIREPGTVDVTAATTPEPDATDEPDTGGEQVHIVQPGDNLYRIGINYGFTVEELATYNGITNVNALDVGQEIRIPPSSD